MQHRSGPFWEAVEGRAPLPPAVTFGLEIIEVDGNNGVAVVAFTVTEAFTDPMGEVLGAFLAAMLYDTAGPALLATLRPGQFQATAQLTVNFLRPAVPGRFIGAGRVVRRIGDLAMMEATLATSDEVLMAAATAAATVIPAGHRRANAPMRTVRPSSADAGVEDARNGDRDDVPGEAIAAA